MNRLAGLTDISVYKDPDTKVIKVFFYVDDTTYHLDCQTGISKEDFLLVLNRFVRVIQADCYTKYPTHFGKE